MSHFSAEQWLNLARGAVAPEIRTVMERHLEEGCGRCQHVHDLWRGVVELTRQEPAYEPPEAAVRAARAAFTVERSAKWLPKRARIAKLIFDSFRQPAAALVRGAAAPSRQLLHKAEPFVIDLRLERNPAKNSLHVMGQVLNSHTPDQAVEAVEVLALRREHITAGTLANASGEFDLEVADDAGLQLFVRIRGEKAIAILLPESRDPQR